MESLAALRRRRAFECRLSPDRALRSLDEADLFLRGRGMLTRTTDCALPSLYEACHEEPFKTGSPGLAPAFRPGPRPSGRGSASSPSGGTCALRSTAARTS
jgi:hypothetical protein